MRQYFRDSFIILVGLMGASLLTYTLLAQRRKMEAIASDRAKSEFLSVMSHELRTPLNAVIGMSSLALKTDLDNKQRGYIEKSQTAANALLKIINDILDFSKLESGRLVLDERTFLVRELCDGVIRSLTPEAGEKRVGMSLTIAPDVPATLIGDPVRLAQMLTILGHNAVKFNKNRGQVRVRVEGKRVNGERVLLHCSVSDTGIGIAYRQQKRLFRYFSQVDGSMTRKYGGIGLGLVICRKLVEMMKGDIWVASEEGRGSTFHFTVKLKITQEPPAEPKAVVSEAERNDTERHGFDVDKVKVEPLLRELHALVTANNIKALEVGGKLKPLLKETGYDNQMEEIAATVGRYDFEEAEEKIVTLASKLGLSI